MITRRDFLKTASVAGLSLPLARSGTIAAMFAYVLPVASVGGAATIPSRLEGWWMASVAGTIAVDRRLPYSASKGAVLALTRSIAIDYATQGIRCNAICPGTVHTPFVEGFLARNFAGSEDAERQKLHARQPIGRMGRPDEIAKAALYLASDEAAFVTGSALTIDGGWTAK